MEFFVGAFERIGLDRRKIHSDPISHFSRAPSSERRAPCGSRRAPSYLRGAPSHFVRARHVLPRAPSCRAPCTALFAWCAELPGSVHGALCGVHGAISGVHGAFCGAHRALSAVHCAQSGTRGSAGASALPKKRSGPEGPDPLCMTQEAGRLPIRRSPAYATSALPSSSLAARPLRLVRLKRVPSPARSEARPWLLPDTFSRP